MLKRIVNMFGGDPNKKIIEEYALVVNEINALEEEYEGLSEEALAGKTAEFKHRLAQGETLDDLMVEAFATVREVSKRTIGQRHYDVQIIGGIILHEGRIAELLTGEGKTLMATMPLYLNALVEIGAHLVTVNDYLARRDARWMAPIYNFLGLSVGVLQTASRSEHGKKGFLVDLSKESTHEDQHQLVTVPRGEAYSADITYGTNNEFGFDYLRDNMARSLDARSQKGHHFAIVDEVDNVLIDEARTPLIISGPSHDDTENYLRMTTIVKRLKAEDYELSEKDRTIVLTEIGEIRVEGMLGEPLRDPERPEDITPHQARLLGFLEQALRAQFLFKRNKDYLVQGGNVVIVDTFTGRLMPGRRWSDGLHQAVEAKEGVKVQAENVTYATITIQNYFRMYTKLSGMSATCLTEAEEFDKIYTLEVIPVPPRVEYIASRPDSYLETHEEKDDYNYKYTYYSLLEDVANAPYFWKRKDYPDVVYRTQEAKLRAIVQEIATYHIIGRPQLVGTTSVANSERLSIRLKANNLRKLLQALLIRYEWMIQHDRGEDGRRIKELIFLNEPLEKVNDGEMRKYARDLNLSTNLETPDNIERIKNVLKIAGDTNQRLTKMLKGGIPHQVLNARKHTEESQIIAGAGALGAVTIATNMAGRGVDIKLGGDLAEEILITVNRVLKRAGHQHAYDLSLLDIKEALEKLSSEDYGIYESEIHYFLNYMKEMAQVKALGGLHVIGSERHEARRIDNQLRGRAARQGDPGSSRFYLAMDDDLMRMFGGAQVDSLMQRMALDDSLPLEAGIVARVIEQSQTRVEGANFDSRKHLLEYDDVLNSQRETIYGQRDRIFVKDDLSEDVNEMLETELAIRVPEGLQDTEGPWRLLSWLNQIQPPFIINQAFFPTYSYKLIIDHVKKQGLESPQQVKTALLELAKNSILAEQEHVSDALHTSLINIQDQAETKLQDKLESLETWFDELDRRDEDSPEESPADMMLALTSMVQVPLKLSNSQTRLLLNDPDEVYEIVRDQIESGSRMQTAIRLIGIIERRLGESLGITPSELVSGDPEQIETTLMAAVNNVYENRIKQYIEDDNDGMIAQTISGIIQKHNGTVTEALLLNLLMEIPRGEVTTFDKKTHRKIKRRTTRLTYTYHAAEFMTEDDPDAVTQDVLTHLQNAKIGLQRAWGMFELDRHKESIVSLLPPDTKKGLQNALGDVWETLVENKSRLTALKGEDLAKALEELGRQALTEVYRQLLLRVISDLWVDYLTQMEGLRVSIGLEAYAQRDPLVQYKSRAFHLFQNLFSDMRLSVINRMFTFMPSAKTFKPQPAPAVKQAKSAQAEGAKPKSKRKRRRKRR